MLKFFLTVFTQSILARGAAGNVDALGQPSTKYFRCYYALPDCTSYLDTVVKGKKSDNYQITNDCFKTSLLGSGLWPNKSYTRYDALC